MILDWTLLLLIPAFLLSAFAQWKVKSTFSKFQNEGTTLGKSGAEIAHHLARARGVQVNIEPHQGFLTDHYNPANKTLALSPAVYEGRSISAFGVAAHEFGHALQHREGYFPLRVRSGLVPLANFGSSFSWALFAGGLFLAQEPLLYAGIALFCLAVLFTLITLPVEFDASNRALAVLREDGLVTPNEAKKVRQVLNAAALTYVAAAAMAIVQLLRMILIARSRD